MSRKVAVIGAGAWGTALACVTARKGHATIVWGRNRETCDEMNQRHTNQAYLGGIALPASITATTELSVAIEDAAIVLLVTPAQTTRAMAEAIKPHLAANTPVVACSKGIDRDSLQTPCEVVESELPEAEVATLSGPSFAVDVAASLPTAVTLGANRLDMAKMLARELSSSSLRIYASDDRKGVELGGALKNVIAISVGVCRGLTLGSSAEAALTTRGFGEITRIARALGGKSETLAGLSGLGDLMLTCSSEKSRNFTYGIALGRGESLSGLKLAEGAKSVFMADKIARDLGIDCPVIATTRQLVGGEIEPQEALIALLNRPLKAEQDG